LLIVLLLIVAASILSDRGAPETTTEFYLLNAYDVGGESQHKLVEGQQLLLQLGVMNHEASEGRYRIEARAEGSVIAEGGSFQVERETLEILPMTIGAPSSKDRARIDIYLFMAGKESPYRKLHVWIGGED
jgi:uncharacterized membrane protein